MVSKEQFGTQNVLEVIVDLSVLPAQLEPISMIILTDSVRPVKTSQRKPFTLKKVSHLHFVHMNVLVLEILMMLILNV